MKNLSQQSQLYTRVLTCNSKCQLLTSSTSRSLLLLHDETVVWKREGIEMAYHDNHVAFSPMEQFLVVITYEGVLVLDAASGNTLHTVRLLDLFLSCCTFISDDKCVISCSVSTVQLLNVKSGEVLSTMDVNDSVTCLAACPLNRVLAVGLDHSIPNFKVIRVHLPRGEDSKNGKR